MFEHLTLNAFDYFLIIIIALSLLFGLIRGFLREIILLATWVAAFTFATLFSKNLALFFEQYIKTVYLAQVISYLSIFIGVLLIGWLINRIVQALVPQGGFIFSNHILGALFGLVRGLVIALFVIFIISISSYNRSTWFTGSWISATLIQPAKWLVEKAKINLSDNTFGKLSIKKSEMSISLPGFKKD